MSGKSKLSTFVLNLALAPILSVVVFGQAPVSQPSAGNAGGATAASTALATKIGLVNIQDAIIGTNEGQKEFDALQTRFAPKENALKALNEEVEGMKKDLQAKEAKLNEDEKVKQLKALEAKQKTLQRDYEDAQNEFRQAQQEAVNRIGQKMLNILEKYGNDNGYSVVLDVSNPQTPVLWANKGIFITKDLVEAYNTAFPVTPSAPPVKPTGAAANRTPAGAAPGTKKP